MPQTIQVEGLTNAEFFERYAAPGRIGLYGGPELINRMINRAQRHLDEDHVWSRWSHAFLFEGRRADGHHWVIESDLDIHRKHIRLGAQENRISKYHDDARTTALAVIDFGLTPEQTDRVIVTALEQVAQRARYSLRELAGTVWAMRHPEWQPRENVLAREQAYFCSAFVRHVFAAVGVDLVVGIAEKNTAPEHIARTEVPHTKWLLLRAAVPESKVRRLVKRVRARVRLRLRKRKL
ncbi:MAG: hypothetical protein HZA93_15055 [Verrucomicrobia bacterium]|nr:hypothetical protein [Verrucomicrobiota bacterium]